MASMRSRRHWRGRPNPLSLGVVAMFGVAAVVAACDASSSGSDGGGGLGGGGGGGSDVYTCNQPNSFVCLDWTFSAPLSSQQFATAQANCAQGSPGGTFSSGSSCSTTGLLGTCTFTNLQTTTGETASIADIHYYTGYPPEGATSATCAGTWTP
jgi:hypothetical protein